MLTGGDDEVIRAFSLSSFRQLGELSKHAGTVTDLCFCGSKHFASASADGTIPVAIKGVDLRPRLGRARQARALCGCASFWKDAPVDSADRTLRLWDLSEVEEHISRGRRGEASKSVLERSGDVLPVNSRCARRGLGVETSTTEFDMDVARASSTRVSSLVLTSWRRRTARVVFVCGVRKAASGGGRGAAAAASRRFAGLRVGPCEQCASLDAWAASFRLVAAASSGAAEAWAPAGRRRS